MGCMVARAVADFSPYMASRSDSPAALQSDDLFIDIQQDSAAAAPLEQPGSAVVSARRYRGGPEDRPFPLPSDAQPWTVAGVIRMNAPHGS